MTVNPFVDGTLATIGGIQAGLSIGLVLVIFGFAFIFILAERRRRK